MASLTFVKGGMVCSGGIADLVFSHIECDAEGSLLVLFEQSAFFHMFVGFAS